MLSECDYDAAHMKAALDEAGMALRTGEVPVGCVLVNRASNTVVSVGHNLTNERKCAVEHAELVAIERLFQRPESVHRSVLSDLDLYVTVEPCIMCAALLLYHGIGRVFYGCSNPRFGGNGSILSVNLDGEPAAGARRCSSSTKEAGGGGEAPPPTSTGFDESSAKVKAEHSTMAGCPSYPSFGGHEAGPAIALLQRFYGQENESAPEHKRRRKEPVSFLNV